jgi:hypothetical protein
VVRRVELEDGRGRASVSVSQGVKKSKDPELVGIIPRAAEYIFERVSALSGSTDTTVAASYVEIYMEKIRDLLDRTKQKVRKGGRVVARFAQSLHAHAAESGSSESCQGQSTRADGLTKLTTRFGVGWGRTIWT